MSESQVVIYGIRNCDTMRKAMAWLDQAGVDYRLHDYRRDGLDPAQLRRWCERLGWESMVNRRGTTWRKLDPALRERLDAEAALQLMQEQPAIIRRPLLEAGEALLVGFDPERYAELFG